MSVAILPEGPTGDAVLEMMGSWTRAGICTPVIVVRPPDVVAAFPEPVRVAGQLLDELGARPVELFAYLGRFRLGFVRIVLGQLLPSGEDAGPTLSQTADAVAGAVRASLPLDPSGEPITRLHRTVLVVPASGVTGAPREILLPTWDANVIISPEDRADVDRPSMFVRANQNFAGHAAAAISAAAGTIRGVSEGALDAVTTDSSSSVDDVVVARVSIRTVIGEDVLDVLGQRVLDTRELGPAGPAPVVSEVNAASEPDLVIARAAGAVLSSPEWAPSPAPQRQALNADVSLTMSVLADAARFNVRSTAAVAAWTITRGRDRLDATATETLVGADVGSIVQVGPRALDRVGKIAAETLDQQKRDLDERLTYEATRGTPPAPRTWSLLRELAFGLADGGPVNAIGELVQLGKREVLAPQDVVPDPEDLLELPGGRALSPYDPLAVHSYREELSRGLRPQREKSGARPPGAKKAGSPPTPLSPPPPPPPPSPGSTSGAAPPAQASIGRDERAVEPAPEKTRRQLAALADHEEAYAAWFERVSGSVLWRVGDDVARRLSAVQRSRQDFLDTREDVTAPVTASLERARGRLLKIWWWTVPLTVLAVGALFLWVGLVVEDPDWGDVLGIAAAVVVFATLVLVLANHAFYKAFRRYEWDLGEAIERQRYDVERYLWEGKEMVRLRVLLAGWQDWTAIIGHVLHRPWDAPRVAFEELPEGVVGLLPASVAVARQDQEHLELPPRVVVRAYQEIYRKGWASHAFDDSYAQFAARLPREEYSGYLEADTDTTSNPWTARGQLLEFWRSGEGSMLAGQRQFERLRRLVREGDLNLPDRVVRRIGPFSDDVQVRESDYFAPTTLRSTTFALDLFGSRARTNHGHYVYRTRIWLPKTDPSSGLGGPSGGTPGGTGMADLIRARAGADRPTESQRSADVQIFDASASAALRVDISRRVHPSSLTLFADGASETRSRAVALDGPPITDPDSSPGSASTGFV